MFIMNLKYLFLFIFFICITVTSCNVPKRIVHFPDKSVEDLLIQYNMEEDNRIMASIEMDTPAGIDLPKDPPEHPEEVV